MNAPATRARRVPWLTLALCATALALHVALPGTRELAFDPSRLSLLRLLGCHLVHFSRLHFVWDTLTFGVIGAVTERIERRRHALFLLVAALFVPPLACALTPWVKHYAGLSGLVLGQVALLLACALQRARGAGATRRAAGLAALLVLLLVKQLYELKIGNTSLITMDYRGFSTVPAAHLVSVVIGALLGALPQSSDGAVTGADTPGASSPPYHGKYGGLSWQYGRSSVGQ
jgi:membrane associated rhomboid family serine protease